MSGGMDSLYNEFQNVPNPNQKEIDTSKIYDKVITIGKRDKDINLITDIPDSYSIVVMESIEDYLLKKYGINKEDKKLVRIMVSPIHNFTTKFKQINPSLNGKRTSEVLSSMSRLFEFFKGRNTVQRLTGTENKE
jgi:hypothetical protein